MNTELAHIIHRAATSPQFHARLVNDYTAMLAEHKLQLSQEDTQVLKDVLAYISGHPAADQPTHTHTSARLGWDGGPSFTAAAI